MKFKLDTPLIKTNFSLSYKDNFSFIGSCFSSEIHLFFKKYCFNTFDIPFGTIYHPISIAQIILKIVKNESPIFTEYENRIYHLDSNQSSDIENKNDFINKISNQYSILNKQFKSLDYLFITFGTSYSYLLEDNSYLVANCHKIPQNYFKSKFNEKDEMVIIWEKAIKELLTFNPNIKIIFTVSPVRHLRDGLIENNRSKARCFDVISKLEDNINVEYFPSFEIINDELRDYRFFKEDLIHPNHLAINYIWETLSKTYFDADTKEYLKNIGNLIKLKEHRIQSNDEKNIQMHNSNMQNLLENMQNLYPEINLNYLM